MRRELFASEGITTLSNSVYGPLILLADIGAVILVFAGWGAQLLQDSAGDESRQR